MVTVKIWRHHVYATCSITPLENCDQVKTFFLARTSDATLIDNTDPEKPGRQILPGEENMDGFYYAVLQKA